MTITPIEEDIYVGSEVSLTATVSPANTTYPTVTWTSDNPKIASIDKESGVLTPLSVGETFVTATCGAVSSTMSITVLPTALTAISISCEEGNFPLNLKDGEEVQLITIVTPADATLPITYTWSSTNQKIATVDQSGLLRANKETGTATITVTATNQAGYEVSQSVEVIVRPTPLSEIIILNREPATLLDGQTLQLSAVTSPGNASAPIMVSWMSSDNDIASVDSKGLVTAGAKVGTATITVTATNSAEVVVTNTIDIITEATPAAEITLKLQEEKTYQVGDFGKVLAIVGPETTTDRTIVWSTDTPDILSVDAVSGEFESLAMGKGVITATCGEISASIDIEVVATPIENISISAAGSTTLRDGDTLQLSVVVNPDNATKPLSLIWSTSDSESAEVDSNGQVKAAAKPGLVTISVIADNEAQAPVEASIVLTIESTPAESLDLNQTTLDLEAGETFQLKAEILPVNTTDKTIIWTSDNEEVATVDNSGNVSAIGTGNAAITATCGEISAVCNVSVTDKPNFVDSIMPESESKDVYTMTGILLKRNASAEYIKALRPGIYIIGGKKIQIR